MNLKQQAETALAGFSADGGAGTLRLSDEQQRLTCELTALDRIACAFSYLTLESPALAESSLDRLREIAENLSARLTYLLEPIHPIETDPQGCVVQMRSSPPQQEEDHTCYYELLVRREGLSLRRWKRELGEARAVVPAEVTREVLLRLIGDFDEQAAA